MPASLSIISAKDGSGVAIVGGLQALDLSGGGTGPWSPASILVDGVSGTNRAAVDSSNRLSVLAAGGGTAGSAATGVITVQGIAAMTKLLVTPDANSAINVAQLNGGTVATGSGAMNSNTQRIALATDSPGIIATGTAGSPASAVLTIQGITAMTALAVSQSGTWTVQPGNTNNTTPWYITAGLDTSIIGNGSGVTLTPKFAVITASASGATTVIAAVTSKKIRVLQWIVTVNAAVNFKWQSHVTPTDISGLFYAGAQGGGAGGAFNPVGHFQTVAGEALDINLSGAVAVGGSLVYVEV